MVNTKVQNALLVLTGVFIGFLFSALFSSQSITGKAQQDFAFEKPALLPTKELPSPAPMPVEQPMLSTTCSPEGCQTVAAKDSAMLLVTPSGAKREVQCRTVCE